MAIREIITGEHHPILRAKNNKVKAFDRELKRFVEDLIETAVQVKGVGLAAPQVGENVHVTVAKIGKVFIPLVNPEIVWSSKEAVMMEEGCLSLPDTWIQVLRAQEIIVQFQDLKGSQQERRLRDLDARVAQHEIDHLNGVLIVDYR